MIQMRTPFAAATRSAAVDLLESVAERVGLPLQVYPSRPKDVRAPTAFVDNQSEVIEYPGVTYRERTIRLDCIVLFGTFDSAESVASRDAFVDALMDQVTDNPHAAGSNTTLGLIAVVDEPTFVPDWVRPEFQKTFYGCRLSLEGQIGNN